MITGGRESWGHTRCRQFLLLQTLLPFSHRHIQFARVLRDLAGKTKRICAVPSSPSLFYWSVGGCVASSYTFSLSSSLSLSLCLIANAWRLLSPLSQRGSMATRPRAGKNQIFDWSQRLVDWNFWPFYCFPQLPNDSISSSYVPERRCVVVVVVSTGGRLPTPPQRALSAGRITQAVIYNSLPLLFQHPSALPSIYRWILLRVRHGVARSGGPSFFKTFVKKIRLLQQRRTGHETEEEVWNTGSKAVTLYLLSDTFKVAYSMMR